MKRTTIVADDDLLVRLKVAAVHRGVSMAALIREALEDKVAAVRPKPRSLGIAESGHADTSTLAGEQRPVPRQWH